MPKKVIALPYSNIFELILENFESRLSGFFLPAYNRKTKVVRVENDDALYAIAEKTNQDKIGFPFFGVKMGNLEPRQEFNTWLLRQSGVTLKNNNDEFFQFQILPININITINMMSNDINDVRLYAQRWVDVAFMHYLNFELDFKGVPVLIRVEIDANFPFPEPQTSDTGTIYDVETTAIIHGYLGSINPILPIKQFNVSKHYQKNIKIENEIFKVQSNNQEPAFYEVVKSQ